MLRLKGSNRQSLDLSDWVIIALKAWLVLAVVSLIATIMLCIFAIVISNPLLFLAVVGFGIWYYRTKPVPIFKLNLKSVATLILDVIMPPKK